MTNDAVGLPLFGDIQGGWPVFDRYLVVKDSLVTTGGHERPYHPLDYQELPFEIAKLSEATEDDIVQFAHRWGVLGFPNLWVRRRWLPRYYFALPDDEDDAYRGEPIGWVRRQARRFRLCVTLLDCLQRKDGKTAADAVREFIETESHASWGTERWALEAPIVSFFEGESTQPLSRILEEKPLDVAALELGSTVSGGITGIYPYLQMSSLVPSESDVLPAIRYHFTAMVELAFLQIARLAVQQGGAGRCEECGSLFHISDKRQRFCPKPPFHHESICANRHRWTRFKRGEQDEQAR